MSRPATEPEEHTAAPSTKSFWSSVFWSVQVERFAEKDSATGGADPESDGFTDSGLPRRFAARKCCSFECSRWIRNHPLRPRIDEHLCYPWQLKSNLRQDCSMKLS